MLSAKLSHREIVFFLPAFFNVDFSACCIPTICNFTDLDFVIPSLCAFVSLQNMFRPI